MVSEFFRFFDEISKKHYLLLEIKYKKIAGYNICIYYGDKTYLEIALVQDSDFNLALAKAYTKLKEWMRENGDVEFEKVKK